jgi:hypothetical protein
MAKSLSTYTTTENIFSSFNFDTVSGILIQWLSHYNVFCTPKELQNPTNAGTCLNQHILILQPKCNNFTLNVKLQGRTRLSLCVCYALQSFPPPMHIHNGVNHCNGPWSSLRVILCPL